MRRYTFIILFALLTILVVACTDDPPSDTRGCIAEEGQAAEEIYNTDDGCLNGSIIAEEGHGEESEIEGEDHAEDAEDADQAQDSEDDGAQTENTQDGEQAPANE